MSFAEMENGDQPLGRQPGNAGDDSRPGLAPKRLIVVFLFSNDCYLTAGCLANARGLVAFIYYRYQPFWR